MPQQARQQQGQHNLLKAHKQQGEAVLSGQLQQ
jgi:hypothetical protein